MKKFKLFKLLALFVVLVISINTAWAANSSLYAGDRLYFDCTNWTHDSARFKINLFGTNGSKVKDVEAVHLTGNIYYIDLDGQYNGFQVLRMSSDYNTQWTYAQTRWAENRNNNDDNLLTLDTCSDNAYPTWGNRSYTLAQNKYIYFDNTKTNWSQPHVRMGKNSYCDAFNMTKVSGTQNLWYYKKTDSSWSGFHAFTISDGAGWTNTNNVFTSNDVSNRTIYWYESVSDDITIIAGNKGGTTSVPSPSVNWYNATKNSGVTTYTVSYSSTGSGTLSVTKYNGSTYDAFSSGGSVQPTQIMKIVTTPSSGNELVSLSVSGATQIGSGNTYYVTGTCSITATFGPLYSVSITKNDAAMGSVSTSSVSAGSATHPEITATPNDGYYFVNWTSSTGSVSVASTTSATTTVTASSTGTLTANFAKRFALRGSRYNDDNVNTEGMPGWDNTTADMDISDGVSSKVVSLRPNREYRFLIYDLQYSAARGYQNENQTLAANTLSGSLDGIYSIKMNTAGLGDYTFAVSVSEPSAGVTYPRVTITNPDSWQISMGLQTKTDGVGTVGTGGSVSAKDGDNYTIVDGNYVKNNGSVTFTATPNDGYQFIGWYSSSTTNGADQKTEAISTENPYTVSSITENKTVYALFKEILFDVTVMQDGTTPVTKQVGVVSHPTITAIAPDGKVFNRWVTTGSVVVYNNGDSGEDTYANPAKLHSVSDNQSTVTATFKDLPYIYYNKAAATGWTAGSMYVYFYTSSYWNDSKGSGYQGRTDYCYEMTQVDEDGDLWRCQYDPKDFSGTITNVAFMEKEQKNNEFFAKNTGSYCDYHSCMNMFVVTSSSGLGKNSDGGNTTYYYNDDWTGNRGYWCNYEDDEEDKVGLASGFYLNNLTSGGFSEEFVDEDGDGVFTVKANLSASTTYKFYVGGCGGGNWSNKDDHLAVGNTVATMYYYSDISSDGNKTQITTTVGGYYTFTLSPSMNSRQLELTVKYPVSSGDYRVTFTHGGKKYPSNIIKSGESSGVVSLWLGNGSNSVDIEKCTNANPVTWTRQVTRTATTSKAGVYTMTLTCNNASSTISTPEAYTGNYYIRTDWAPGGWQDYKENRLIQNALTFSEADATTFDYYFCKWISKSGSDANVRCVIANEYNMAISDTLLGDATLGGVGTETLPAAANVRFSYNSYTNEVKRAYIAGSTNPNDRFLIMKGDAKLFDKNGNALNYSGKYDQLTANEAYFSDNNNWVYEVDLQAQSGSEVYLVARYNGSDRDLYGSSSSKKTLITSSNTTKHYDIQVTYDFKTNNLMTAWKPGSATISETISGVPSVMLLRDHQGGADQIVIGDGGSISGTTVYGVMQFNKYTLNNQSRSAGHATLDPELTRYERDLFYISFPFDVKLSDVFGFGTYAKHWIIEYYDGADRAAKGFWADSESFWKFVTPAMRDTMVLRKGFGYILALDLDELGAGSSVWNNSVTDVYLYFPSNTAVTITNSTVTVNVPAHTCTIDRRTNKSVPDINKDRTIADSHWNVIGVPSFSNIDGLDSVKTIKGVDYPSGLGFYYKWVASTNSLDVTAKSDTTHFKTMHAYVVQFTGQIDWTKEKAVLPEAVAARMTEIPDKYYKLSLMLNDAEQDRTFVEMTDDVSVTTGFEFNHDLFKEMSGARSNIWTVTTDGNPVAGNSMPHPLATTIVPVGVKIATAGEYTFSMPEGTNGENVWLLDNQTGSRTNLGLMDYTVNLTAGTIDGRFSLEFGPIQDAPTGIDEMSTVNSQLSTDSVRKVFVGGRLYIIRDGKAYDATGKRVE